MVNGSPAPLFTRPPTPPKENVEDSTKISIDQTYQGTLGQQVLLDTPDESPASSSEYFNGSGGKLPKRVVFSPWTSYHKPLVPMNKTTTPDGKLRPLLPSKQCVASHKSILKVSTNNSSPSFDMPQQLVLDPNETVAVMLRSVTQHLSSASRDSRLDSYKTLLGCLSAYEEVPDTQSLIQSLTAFLEYIRRDIAAKQATSGGPDVELASHALKVLKAILYTPGLTAAVPHEFGTFIAEQAVSSMESQDTPKVMLDHYMQLLAQQKLPQKIINSEKANRILNALNGLETRIKGNRVIGLKLMIYQRLLVQATSLMVPRAVDWLEFLIVSMSSSIKDIRSRAIAFGIDAALTLGTTSTVSQSCIDILDRETPAGPKVVDCLGTRMVELLNVKNEGLHVPQMWIVTVLFLRSRRRQIERWQHMQGWLGIMQRAFNSSDPKVKLQANIAWNRLVAATNLDTSTSTKFIRMLRQPIASQLERKTNDNQMRHAKQIARSTYCNLLYYAFHPGATFEHLDLYWDGYVAPVLSIRPSMEKSDVEFACRVLGALFSSTQPRIWNHNRAHQLTPMKPEELPCLDPKWTRSRAAKVISVLENLPLHITLAQPGDVLATPYFETWRSFVKALGDAASKEIKVSMETMTAMAHIMTMLYRYWSQSYNSSKEIPPRLDVFVALINETVAKVGFRPFTEKRLFHARPESSFEAAETPSSHSGRPQRILKSPITFLLDALVNATPVHEPAATYRAAVKSLLDVALRTASGRRTYLVVLWELAQDIILGCPGENSNRVIFWEYLVKETARAIAMPPLKTQDNDNHGHPGNDYREALRLLELGIREFGYETYTEWKTLSNAVIGSIQDDGGHAGILLVYTEPLSKIISEEEPHNTSDNFLRCGTYILENIRWPESRQALERVRKQLWGPGFTPRGPPALDPFNHLYLMVEGLLTWTYPRLRSLSLDVVTQFMASVNSLLLSCPASLRVVCLKRIQRGLGVWIEDKDAVVPRSDGIQKSNDLKAVIKATWRIVLDTVKSIATPESSSLASISELLAAGFSSRHEAIVNDLIGVWNQTFGKTAALDYPAPLHRALTRFHSRGDIELPTFVNDEQTEIMSSPFDFVDSQDNEAEPEPEMLFPTTTCFLNLKAGGDILGSRSKDTVQSPVAKKVVPRGTEATPKRKLRHNDSQIQFTAIDSSPPAAPIDESQHLSEHQKEIRAQQKQGAAAMFPEIRSSPTRSRSAERRPELVLHRKQAFSQPLDADAEPSPTFPPGDTIMNEFLGSSPTPRSSRRSSVDVEANKDPGSSPPNSPPPSPKLRRAVGTKVLTPRKCLEEDIRTLNSFHDAPPAIPSLPTTENSLPNTQGVLGTPKPSFDATGSLKQPPTEADTQIMSDPDEFVDAPADPIEKETNRMTGPEEVICATTDRNPHTKAVVKRPAIPRTRDNHEQVSAKSAALGSEGIAVVGDSFPVRVPFTPSQEEQVREQLLRDLEEASSQGNRQGSKRRASFSTPSKVGKKRKIQPANDTKRSTASKLPASFQSCEVVVEKRRLDESRDFVIIDDRPATGQGRLFSPAIKQEMSPSPAATLQAQCARAATPKKMSARRRTRSMTSHESLRSSVVEDPIAPSARSVPMNTSEDRQETATTEQRPRKRRRTEPPQEMNAPSEGSLHRVEIARQLPRQQTSDLDQGGLLARQLPLERPAVLPTEDDMTSSQIEGVKDLLLTTCDTGPGRLQAGEERPPHSSSEGDTVANAPHDGSQYVGGPESAEPPARSPGQRILDRFLRLLGDVKQVTFWPEEERKMVEVAFELVKDVHEAGRKNVRQGP